MEYWNAPGFVPAPMPRVATQPAPQIDIAAGAAYREKKLLADALRKKAEREYTPVSGLIQSEGANGSPGYTQIDYAGILNNFMQPGFQQAREEKAAAAEGEAQAARAAALKGITGDMTPEQMMQLGDQLEMPELTKSAVEQMMPQKLNLAQRAQSSTSKAGLMALRQMGQISPEEYDQAVSNLDAEAAAELERERDQYTFEQRNKAFAPNAGSSRPNAEETKFNLWLGANEGKNYNDYLAAVAGGDKTSATEIKAIDKVDGMYEVSSKSLSQLEMLQDIIHDPQSDLFSTPQKAAAGLNRFGESVGGGMGAVLQSVATGLLNPDAMITKKEAIRLATADLQQVGGNDSNYELMKMLEQYPSNEMSQESAAALIDGLYKVTAVTNRALEMEAEARRSGTYHKPGGKPKGGYWQAAKRELWGEDPAAADVGTDDDLLNKYAPK